MMVTTTILIKQCICVCIYLYTAYFKTMSLSHRLHSGKW